MDTEIKRLIRFTSIPFLIHLLKTKKLTLLNPILWQDRNDKQTIEFYRKAVNKQSIYALCLTHDSETIGHWNTFAGGTSGCSIEFNKEPFLEKLKEHNLLFGKTIYYKVGELWKKDIPFKELPFVKRHRFDTESEFRIIAVSDEPQEMALDIDIKLDLIKEIKITGLLPKSVSDSLMEVLEKVDDKFKGKFHHSTLFENQTWINHFKNMANEYAARSNK